MEKARPHPDQHELIALFELIHEYYPDMAVEDLYALDPSELWHEAVIMYVTGKMLAGEIERGDREAE